MKARIGPPSKLLSFGKVKTIEAVLEWQYPNLFHNWVSRYETYSSPSTKELLMCDKYYLWIDVIDVIDVVDFFTPWHTTVTWQPNNGANGECS